MFIYRQYIKEKLQNSYSEEEIKSFYFLLLEHITGFSRAEILANKNSDLSDTQLIELKSFVLRLQNHEPIQHILGKTIFCHLPFEVNKQVLIPRPETEELVHWILHEIPVDSSPSILDIGTGSACIAISLAHALKKASVTALDICPQALEVAKRNAQRNNVSILFEEMDVLSTTFLDSSCNKFDIIVSNPPYICEKESKEMEKNVLNYEPSKALFVPDSNPLLFYSRIADFANKNLNSHGKLFFEINRAYGKETINMLYQKGFKQIELRKDFFENERMVKGIKA